MATTTRKRQATAEDPESSPKNKRKADNETATTPTSPNSVANPIEGTDKNEGTVATVIDDDSKSPAKDDSNSQPAAKDGAASESKPDEKKASAKTTGLASAFVVKKESVKANKFGRKSKIDPRVKEARDSLTIYLVNPKNVTGEKLPGALILATGFRMDDWLTDKLFIRGMTKEKQEFVDTTGAVPWVFHAKDKDGKMVFKKGKQANKPLKVIAIITDDVLTETELMEMIHDTITPTIKNHYHDDSFAVAQDFWSDRNAPKMVGNGKDNIIEVDCWSKVLHGKNDPFVIGDNASETGLSDWLSKDKSHLCQLFEEGSVPIEEFRQRNLPASLLRGIDKQHHYEHELR